MTSDNPWPSDDTVITALSPAKINLFLHVIGRRPDGYHLLQSLFLPLNLCDTLYFRRRTDQQLSRIDLSLTLPPDDLSLRAARLLQSHSASPFGVDIAVHKRIPWGAGLGGGSSNAAHTLLSLNRLWQVHYPLDQLADLGAQLGADVPFFVHEQAAWVEGVGEIVTPLPSNLALPQHWVLVKPPVALATPAVFQQLTPQEWSQPIHATDWCLSMADASPTTLAQFGRNDLQAPAISLCPEIAQTLDWLRQQGLEPRMSGSGSTVFAALPSHKPLQDWQERLNTAWPPAWADANWLLCVCSTLETRSAQPI